jgi:hypothetical protein
MGDPMAYKARPVQQHYRWTITDPLAGEPEPVDTLFSTRPSPSARAASSPLPPCRSRWQPVESQANVLNST